MWKFFLIGQNWSTNQRSGMILVVQIQFLAHVCDARAGALASKFSFSKIPGGPNINVFFMKIGMELPFTLKNKRSNTNLKIDF